VLKALSDDAERQRLHLRDSRLGAVAVGQNARQLQYFGQPAAVVFSLGFDLEGDQVSTTSASIVRCPRGFREIQLTTVSGAAANCTGRHDKGPAVACMRLLTRKPSPVPAPSSKTNNRGPAAATPRSKGATFASTLRHIVETAPRRLRRSALRDFVVQPRQTSDVCRG